MGRPPLPIGTAGKVRYVHKSSGLVQARAMFRDYDGRARVVAKDGRTRAAADRALKIELASRQTPASSGAVAVSTRVADLAQDWLAATNNWSTGTERTYRSVVRNQVVPALGALRVREVTPGVIA